MASFIAPMLAIVIMRYFRLSNFFDKDKIIFRYVIFLIILSSMINTFFLYIDRVSNVAGKNVDAIEFIQSTLTGDILGGIVFVLIVLKLLPRTLRRPKLT